MNILGNYAFADNAMRLCHHDRLGILEKETTRNRTYYLNLKCKGLINMMWFNPHLKKTQSLWMDKVEKMMDDYEPTLFEFFFV